MTLRAVAEQPWTEAAKARGDQHGWDKDDEGGAVLEPGVQAPTEQKHESDGGRGGPIVGGRGRGVVQHAPEAVEPLPVRAAFDRSMHVANCNPGDVNYGTYAYVTVVRYKTVELNREPRRKPWALEMPICQIMLS